LLLQIHASPTENRQLISQEIRANQRGRTHYSPESQEQIEIADNNHTETNSLTDNFEDEMKQFEQNLKRENSISESGSENQGVRGVG
jgi:hypothetical protein